MSEEWKYLTDEEIKKYQQDVLDNKTPLQDETIFDLGPTMTCDIEKLIPGFRVKK